MCISIAVANAIGERSLNMEFDLTEASFTKVVKMKGTFNCIAKSGPTA